MRPDSKKIQHLYLRAFSLPELLVVLVIIGILVLIALPNLMPMISRAKSTEAQQQLTYLHTLQRSNFYTSSRYSPSLDELGFEQSKLVTDGRGGLRRRRHLQRLGDRSGQNLARDSKGLT